MNKENEVKWLEPAINLRQWAIDEGGDLEAWFTDRFTMLDDLMTIGFDVKELRSIRESLTRVAKILGVIPEHSGFQPSEFEMRWARDVVRNNTSSPSEISRLIVWWENVGATVHSYEMAMIRSTALRKAMEEYVDNLIS